MNGHNTPPTAATRLDVLELYRRTGAYLEGHFLLASGRHSATFLQSTTVLQHPEYAERIGYALAARLQQNSLQGQQPDFVLGPAMGGVVLSYIVARALGCRALFAEKDTQGAMHIREAFRIGAGERFVAVEDVITTGGSLYRAVDAAQNVGAQCLGVGCIIDRGQSQLPANLAMTALMQLSFRSYAAEECPLCRADIPLEKI